MATATGPITLDPFSLGSTDRIRLTIKRDGTAWDLSGPSDTVILRFEKPDRTTRFDREMEAEDAAGGVFYYDTTVDEIDVAGWWTLNVKVTDGTMVKKYPHPISFLVNDEP